MGEQGASDRLDPRLEQSWADACTAVYRVLRRGRSVVGRSGIGPDLTESQVSALESIANKGPLPMGVMASEAGVRQPTMTRMMRSLEARGIVQRSASQTDDRVVLVSLTEEGRGVWQSHHDVLRDYQRASLLSFPADEREQALATLTRFIEIIEEQIAERNS